MRKILVVIVVVFMVGGSVKWYKRHQVDVEAKEVASVMKDATATIVQQIAFFKDPHGETYVEVLESADGSIKRIGISIDNLTSRKDVHDGSLVAHGVDYLKTTQEAVRAIRQVVRIKANLTATIASMERTVGALQDFVEDPSDPDKKFHSDVAKYGTSPLLRKSQEEKENLDVAAEALGKSLSKLVAQRDARPKILPLDVYVTNEAVMGISFSLR